MLSASGRIRIAGGGGGGGGKACEENELVYGKYYKPNYDSPDSGEWLAHAHKVLVNRYQALFFCPANFNIKIGPGYEARGCHAIIVPGEHFTGRHRNRRE